MKAAVMRECSLKPMDMVGLGHLHLHLPRGSSGTRSIRMRRSSLGRAACAVLLLLCIIIDLQPAEGFTCSGGSGRAECGVAWPEGGPYFTPSSSCASCSGCSCPAASCLQVVSACIAAPGLVSYEVGFTECKGSNTSSSPSAIDWVAFQGLGSAGSSYVIHSALNPNTTLYTFDNTTACDNVYGANSSSTCCLQRNVNGNGQINQFTIPCGTRPLAWMMDSSFRSCMRPENIPPYVTDATGPNQCSGGGDETTQLCGPYELEQLTCDNLLPCSGAVGAQGPAPTQPADLLPTETGDSTSTQDTGTDSLPPLTSKVAETSVWSEYTPTCTVGSICRYARNPCELDAYWRDDCTCPEFNPVRYGYCRYSWSSETAESATCTCGADEATVIFVPVYYPAVVYSKWWSRHRYWCHWGNCGNSWGWDWCWKKPCRPICWGWGCPAYPWWKDRPRPTFWPGVRPVWWNKGLGWGCRHGKCGGWPGGAHVGCIGRDCIFNVGRRPGGLTPSLLGNDCRGSHCRLLCGRNGACPGWNAAPPRTKGRPTRNVFVNNAKRIQVRNFNNVPRVRRLPVAVGAAPRGVTRPGALGPVGNHLGTTGFGVRRRPGVTTPRINDLRGKATPLPLINRPRQGTQPQINRPQINRPQPNRPLQLPQQLINRPQINRPKIDRPQINRPQIDRPQINRPKVDRTQISRRFEQPRPQIDRTQVSRRFEQPRPQIDRTQVSRRFEQPRPQIDRTQVSRRFEQPRPQQSFSRLSSFSRPARCTTSSCLGH